MNRTLLRKNIKILQHSIGYPFNKITDKEINRMNDKQVTFNLERTNHLVNKQILKMLG